MSLKARLIAAFSLLIGLTLFLGLLLISAQNLLREKYSLHNQQRQILNSYLKLYDLHQQRQSQLDSFILGIAENDFSLEDLTNSEKKELALLLQQVKQGDNKLEAEKIAQEINAIQNEVLAILSWLQKNNRKVAISLMTQELQPFLLRYGKDLLNRIQYRQTLLLDTWKSAENLSLKVQRVSIGVVLFVFLLGVALMVFLYLSISRPLAVLREGAKRIGAGDLKFKLSIDGPKELEDLARTIEEMATSLADLQIKVVQMGRMSAVGTLAGGVAHEINNPLTGVLGQAQILLMQLEPENPIRKNVEKIERAALRCKTIVRGLLDFSRPQEYHFEPLEIADVVNGALSMCETELHASKVKLEMSFTPELPKILASNQHLQQVFLNLFTNALHAMQLGGTLRVWAEVRHVALSVKDKKLPLQNYMYVFVQDTGEGIDPKNIGKLFDPFFTTKEVGKGTGLGLSISYGILQQHNGDITVYSEGRGRGTTFCVIIPCV